MPRASKKRFKVTPRTDLEKPTHPVFRGRFYAQTQLVDPSHAPRAHDDQIKSVRVYKPSANGKRTGLGGHWDGKDGREKPLLPLYAEKDKYPELLDNQPPTATDDSKDDAELGSKKKRSTEKEPPVAALCKLPGELQDMILRQLLLWPCDISLFKGWTLVYPHSKPRLSGLAVLRTCRSLHNRGADILYGENKLLYEIRDPATTDAHAARIMRSNVYPNCTFPFKRYGSRIRFVRIGIDTGRVGMDHNRYAFISALEMLLPENRAPPGVGRDIHTLTIELPAMTEQNLRGLTSLPTRVLREADIPICGFFNEDSRTAETIKKLQPRFLQIRIPSGSPNDGTSTAQRFYASNVDLRGCFTNLAGGGLGLLPENNSTDDTHQKQIRKFHATVANISLRICCLVSDPHSRLSKALWVVTQEETLEDPVAFTRDDDEHLVDAAERAESVVNGTDELPPVLQRFSRRLHEREKHRRNIDFAVRQWLNTHQSYSDLENFAPPMPLSRHRSRDRYLRAQTEGPRTITSAEARDALMKHNNPHRRVHDSSGTLRYHTLDREPGLAKFSVRGVEEMTLLGRELYHLGELKANTKPLRIGKGHLRASNARTARLIRDQIQKFNSKKLARESG